MRLDKIMILAKIGTTDITQYINESSYVMNSEPVTSEWVDANYTTHRDEYRRKVKGSFDLTFVTQTDYNGFIDLLHDNTAGIVTVISVYVGDDVNDLKTINAYCRMQMSKYRSISADYSFNRLKMTVEEL